MSERPNDPSPDRTASFGGRPTVRRKSVDAHPGVVRDAGGEADSPGHDQGERLEQATGPIDTTPLQERFSRRGTEDRG